MAETAVCPHCGLKLPAHGPGGLCPACLFRRALETAGSLPEDDSAGWLADPPPTCQELAASFPDLEVLRFLGRGGMGMVYQARQKHLGRMIALKILHPRLASDPQFAERFSREARMMALLTHPHAVAVYEFGQVPPSAERESPLYFLLMEYVDGLTLRQLLDAGELTSPQALAIIPQICDALQYAHDKGVVHRDIKPENILLNRQGEVKIADFGLAKLMGLQAHDLTLSSTGQVLGTLNYMAPEQMERPLEVDHRADIYSVGVVFYQMLTGELPLGRFAPPSQKVAIDARLDEVVLRALEKEPARRYQQASLLRSHVETIAQTAPPASVSRTPSTLSSLGSLRWKSCKRLPRRTFWLVAALAGLLCVLFVMIGWNFLSSRVFVAQLDLAVTPFKMKDATTEELIAAGLRLPESPWAWRELDRRPLTAEQGQKIAEGVLAGLKQENRAGPLNPSQLFNNPLRLLNSRGLMNEQTKMEILTHLIGEVTNSRIVRTRAGQPKLDLDLRWRPTGQDPTFDTVTLNEVTAIEVDGNPIPLPAKPLRMPKDFHYSTKISLPQLNLGKHSTRVTVLTAIVSSKDVTALRHDAPSSDWPPARKQWFRSTDIELQVFADDAKIVSLSQDPRLDPSAMLRIDSILIRRSGEGCQAILEITGGPERLPIALSCDVSLQLEDQVITGRELRFVVKPNRISEGSGGFAYGTLSKNVGMLRPETDTAEVILTPKPEWVELDGDVDQIWGQEITFKNIPLRRLDLATSAPQ